MHEPLLTQEVTNKLIKKAQAGSIKCRNLILTHNRGLVVSLAMNYFCKMFSREDLINEGYIGMISAINRFDPDVKCAFSTYATFWIRQRIMRFVQDNRSTIRIPVYIHEKLKKITKEGMTRKEANNKRFNQRIIAAEKALNPVSLDYLLSLESQNSTLHDVVADTNEHEDYAELYRIIGTLEKRQADILRLRLQGFVLREIAVVYNITRERVRQIQKQAIEILQFRCRNGFPDY